MNAGREKLLSDLGRTVAATKDRIDALRMIADLIRAYGSYRWVGLYDVDHTAGVVTNIMWSGPSAPDYPTFAITKGLTSAAVAERRIVNARDVSRDPRYLTALGSTRSEIIVPVFDEEKKKVIATIDVESERQNAFGSEVEAVLEACAEVIRPLWRG
jgi:putative methionine-R-sulfoxide reductase with GAF domain